MQGENDIQHDIMEYLLLRGFKVWRQNIGRTGGVNHGAKGMSDIGGILPGGKYLAVEVKRQDGKLTVEQRVFLDTVRELGGLAVVARSVADVVNAINDYLFALERRTGKEARR